MKIDEYDVVTLRENPALRAQSYGAYRSGWAKFMLHNATALAHKEDLAALAADYQFFLLDGQGEVVAICKSIPYSWNGKISSLPTGGYEYALTKAMRDLKKGRGFNTLLGLSVTIPHEHRERRVSVAALEAMQAICRERGVKNLLLPLRPSAKCHYPLTSMAEYITWQDGSGRWLDPWLRTHQKLGGKVLKIAPRSMVITGTVAEWEEWTQMRFPASGRYVVPGALTPVMLNRERDVGRYVEPNVWVLHETG